MTEWSHGLTAPVTKPVFGVSVTWEMSAVRSCVTWGFLSASRRARSLWAHLEAMSGKVRLRPPSADHSQSRQLTCMCVCVGNVHIFWMNPHVDFDTRRSSFPNLQRRNVYVGELNFDPDEHLVATSRPLINPLVCVCMRRVLGHSGSPSPLLGR